MRKKEEKTISGFGVADGLDFGADIEEAVIPEKPKHPRKPNQKRNLLQLKKQK